jgi:hypothetical protein
MGGPFRQEDTMKALRDGLFALAAVLVTALALLVTTGCATREYYHVPYEMAEVYGAYPLSDGDTLRVEKRGQRAWARLNGTEAMKLTAVGPLEFVTQDRTLHLRFEPLAFTTEVQVLRLPGSGVQGELGK